MGVLFDLVVDDDDDDDDAVVAVSWWRAVGVFELLGRLDCCRSVRYHQYAASTTHHCIALYTLLHCAIH